MITREEAFFRKDVITKRKTMREKEKKLKKIQESLKALEEELRKKAKAQPRFHNTGEKLT